MDIYPCLSFVRRIAVNELPCDGKNVNLFPQRPSPKFTGTSLGGIVLETDNGGTFSADQTYYAGACPALNGSEGVNNDLATDHRFTGQKQDSTGLYYYSARYYDPSIGQFVSPDTIVPDPGLVADYNRYAYARGNPLKYTDPTGHVPCYGCDDPISVEWQKSGSDYDQYLSGARQYNSYRHNPEELLNDRLNELTDSTTFGRITAAETYAEHVQNVYLDRAILTDQMVVSAYNEVEASGDRGPKFNAASSLMLGFVGMGDRFSGGGTYYHYTDANGAVGIVESGVIRANRGRVYVTVDEVSADEASYTLFAGNPNYAGRGGYVVKFKLRDGVDLYSGDQPNELIHPGSLYNGRHIDIMSIGPND